MRKKNEKAILSAEKKLAHLPSLPGIYLMKDAKGAILYVGKAKVLKNRVKSYFGKGSEANRKTRLMVSKVADLETIVTKTEKEALILEHNLIKRYRPPFNINYRDDKNYPYLKLSLEETYPTLTIVRQPRKDKSQYFGPFASSCAVHETLRLINRLFSIRKCHGKQLKKSRPCIYFQIGKCPAPCCKEVDPTEYRRAVHEVQLFLQGRGREVVSDLKKKMEQASCDLKFEQAARIRNRIYAIEKTLEKQTIVNLDFVDRDVFSFCRQDDKMEIIILFIRNGRMCGTRNISFQRVRLSNEDVFSSLFFQYYNEGNLVPSEIIAPLLPADREVLEQWLSEKRGSRVSIIMPRSGQKRDLLMMATKNAELLLQEKNYAEKSLDEILHELKETLHLKNYPSRIECIDISNIMGTSAVGSLVVFADGQPYKNGYRRFRIKTVQQADDYAMMYEVISRHLRKLTDRGSKPDLIIVDGGKGQLSVLLRSLKDQDMNDIDAIAIAKGRRESGRGKGKWKKEERIFIPNKKEPLILPSRSRALLLLQRIRDEAHRFAISYHRRLKEREDFVSPLKTIPGIGEKTIKSLLSHFESIKGVKQATIDELTAVRSVSKNRARIIYNFFHSGIKQKPI